MCLLRASFTVNSASCKMRGSFFFVMPEVFYPASSLLLSGREVDSGSTPCRNDVISGHVLLQEWRSASFGKKLNM